jgi:hypothetical protein
MPRLSSCKAVGGSEAGLQVDVKVYVCRACVNGWAGSLDASQSFTSAVGPSLANTARGSGRALAVSVVLLSFCAGSEGSCPGTAATRIALPSSTSSTGPLETPPATPSDPPAAEEEDEDEEAERACGVARARARSRAGHT